MNNKTNRPPVRREVYLFKKVDPDNHLELVDSLEDAMPPNWGGIFEGTRDIHPNEVKEDAKGISINVDKDLYGDYPFDFIRVDFLRNN